jgi:hypothetical protein
MAVRLGGAARWPKAGEVAWMSAEELLAEGFRRSRVAMLNEATSGLRRSVRTRRVGIRVLPTAWAAGARLLAVEALGPPGGEPPDQAVLDQPEMAELLAAARDLGFRVTGYDADGAAVPLKLRTKAKSPAFSNWRDDQQATNLANLLAELPGEERLLVWAGNLHHAKTRFMAFQPTGWRFMAKTGVEPFVLDQTVTVAYTPTRAASPVLAWARHELQRRDGEAGFVWREGLPRLGPGSDAWLLSLDNEME